MGSIASLSVRGVEALKNYVAELATPRVIERERQLLEQVDHALGVFVADIERAMRDADTRIPGLLDATDVRLALTDLRARGAHFAASVDRGAKGVDALLELIASVKGLGTGGVKAATSAEAVADAASRAIDHVEGYMISHGHIPETATMDRPHPGDVRKFATSVTVQDVASWRPAREARFHAVGLGPAHATRA